MNVTAYQIAERYLGIREVPGAQHHPMIVAWLNRIAAWAKDDETPWCAAFVDHPAFELDLPRPRSLGARSWLTVGNPVELSQARRGFDVVVLSRGTAPQPGPEVLRAPGHVGWFSRLEGEKVYLLGGNQGNAVSIAGYPIDRVLGVRRLHEERTGAAVSSIGSMAVSELRAATGPPPPNSDMQRELELARLLGQFPWPSWMDSTIYSDWSQLTQDLKKARDRGIASLYPSELSRFMDFPFILTRCVLRRVMDFAASRGVTSRPEAFGLWSRTFHAHPLDMKEYRDEMEDFMGIKP